MKYILAKKVGWRNRKGFGAFLHACRENIKAQDETMLSKLYKGERAAPVENVISETLAKSPPSFRVLII